MFTVIVTGCGTTKVKRTLNSDPNLRILIDPSIPMEHYVEIRRAFVESGKVEVIDRREGFDAAIREQNTQFRSGYQDRFSDREKWMHIGRMYGAASIVTGYATCYNKTNWLGHFVRECKQNLAFINGRTGVVEIAVNGKNSIDWTAEWVVPDWDDVVVSVIEKYPEYFEPRKIEPVLEKYMDQSEEYSRRERDNKKSAPETPRKGEIADTLRYIESMSNQLEQNNQ